MTTLLGVSALLLSLAAFVAASKMKGYSKGKADGYHTGYQEGFRAARETVEFFQSLDWWSVAEREVKQEREAIKHESGNQEGWP